VVVEALAAPVRLMVAPLPLAAGVIVPERVKVCGGFCVAVKLTPVTLAELIVAFWLAGVKLNPVLLGVTVYLPLARLLKE